jgi:hypothetical protein
MRALMLALLVGMIGIGATLLSPDGSFDQIEDTLRETQIQIQDTLGSQAQPPISRVESRPRGRTRRRALRRLS